jgi:hypothetical protein
MITAALLVATLADAPTVRVDIDALALPNAEAEQLHGELMTRLVEEGHPVGSPAVVTVRLVGGGEALHVEVQHGSRRLERDVEGEGAVRRLAVIHAVLDLLTELERDGAIDPEVGPSRDRFVFVDAEPGAERWLGDVLRALTENGRVATSDPREAPWRVCVSTSEDGRVAVAAASADGECPPGRSHDDLEAAVSGALADAMAADTVDTVERAPGREEPPAESASASPRLASPRPVAPTRAPESAAPRFSGVLGAGIGAQGRLQEPEVALLVHGDARHARGGLLTLRVELAPSTSDPVSALDTWLTAGGGFAFAPLPKLRIELAGTLGVAVHGFWVGSDRGARADFAAAVPVTIAGRLGKRLELGAQLVGGWSLRSRTHEVGGAEAWSRDAWRVGGLVVLRILLGRETLRSDLR